MTKPANNHQKPSPSDTPTKRPDDDGHESVQKKSDKEYRADEPEYGNIAQQQQNDEQPVNPITTPPTEDEGMKEGKVQP
jgi:hypothetical protein